MAITAVALGPEYRTDALRRLAEEQFDVLVIGAGVVGAGAALDAASRGLKVGLVEARDFASGTSSRSSKLVHGGLRYLKQLNFPLVFEALRERKLILETAVPAPGPTGGVHLPAGEAGRRPRLGRHGRRCLRRARRGPRRAQPPAAPVEEGDAALVPVGQAGRDQGRHRVLRGPARRRPAHDDDRPHRGRLRRRASRPAPGSPSFLRDGDRVVGAVARDLESGNEIRIRAKADDQRRRGLDRRDPGDDRRQGPVPGAGVARACTSSCPRDRIDSDTGLITETEKSLLFIIPCPWSDDFWVIGTTDTPWDLDLAHPAASSADIDYILEHANALLAKPLTRDDVVGVYAGLRPLLAGESDETSKLSREHAVRQPGPRAGDRGGRQVHDLPGDGQGRAWTWPPRSLGKPVPSCLTDDVPLVGAEGYKALVTTKDALAARSGLSVERIEHLLGRYGIGDPRGPRPRRPSTPSWASRWSTPRATSRSRPTTGPRTRARCTWTTSWPAGCGCRSTPGTAVSTSPHEVAEIVAPVLGWDGATIEREVEHYRKRVAAERDSQHQLDDQTADAARLGAPEVRVGAG